MPPRIASGLNDSGEEGVTRIVRAGALHHSRSQQTARHAHYAWKIHVGLDAPVWLDSPDLQVPPQAGVRALMVPPNVAHATGAIGWSVAIFVSPGTHHSGWPSRAIRPSVLSTNGIEETCHELVEQNPVDLLDAVSMLALSGAGPRPDTRVRSTLDLLREDPDIRLEAIARQVGLSLDRLSRLVSKQTGMRLRRHVLWQRLLRAISSDPASGTLADIAQDAGFSDHAHMTRTYRAFLGRAPSEFKRPPEVWAPW